MTILEITDDWADLDKAGHRDRLAQKYLKGSGIEIGALHKPTNLSLGTEVKYVDYKTREENLAQYPELKNKNIVNTDIIDEGFVLSKVGGESQYFIIANQVLEHSPNPIGTLKAWLSKIRQNGHLLLSVPIADRCFDKGRPITSLAHLIDDYKFFSECNVDEIIKITRTHVKEFMEISGLNIRKKAGLTPATPEQQREFLGKIMSNFQKQVSNSTTYDSIIEAHVKFINLKYDVHYHTFSATSFLDFSKYFAEENGCFIEEITKSGGGEVIAVLKKN